MYLSKFLESRRVSKWSAKKIEGILKHELPGCSYTNPTTGVLVLKDEKGDKNILKCVYEYYTNDSTKKKIKIGKTMNPYTNCAKISKELTGVDYASTRGVNCSCCHLDCMNLIKEKRLFRAK